MERQGRRGVLEAEAHAVAREGLGQPGQISPLFRMLALLSVRQGVHRVLGGSPLVRTEFVPEIPVAGELGDPNVARAGGRGGGGFRGARPPHPLSAVRTARPQDPPAHAQPRGAPATHAHRGDHHQGHPRRRPPHHSPRTHLPLRVVGCVTQITHVGLRNHPPHRHRVELRRGTGYRHHHHQ